MMSKMTDKHVLVYRILSFIALYFLTTSVQSQKCLQDQLSLNKSRVCSTYPCADLCDGSFIVGKENCSKASHCCFVDGVCFIKQINISQEIVLVNEKEIGKSFEVKVSRNARDLSIGGTPVSLIKQLFPDVPICLSFPNNCLLSHNTTEELQVSIDIPYCQRIACQPGNPYLDIDPNSCLLVPGCKFDFSLHFYRNILSQGYLPGVPVCHLAVRNDVFLKNANKYLKKSGAQWNPLLTNCLINEYQKQIFSESTECAKLKVFRELGYQAKQAGWTKITPRDCFLINGCWLDDRCFYPLPSGSIRTKSAIHEPEFDVNSYGKPQCAPLNKSMKDENFLDSHHLCLKAGCSSGVGKLEIIEHLLRYGAIAVPSRLRSKFFASVVTGQVRPDNYKEFIRHSITNDHLLSSSNFNENSLKLPGSGFARFDDRSFDLNPLVFPQRPSIPCPFQNLNWPNFPPLSGSFEGCCEMPLCYLPRISIREARSEIASYETPWKSWTECSTTCGSGVQTRKRFCIGDKCGKPQEQSRFCDLGPCPIKLYSPWSEYGACSVSCGGGVKIRKRSCALLNGCKRPMQETVRCRTGRCPTIRYGQWSRCSRTCGFGMQQRRGRCEHPGDYGCSRNIIQERRCERFCGHIRYRESSCNQVTCLITKTRECVLGDGRPGYCREAKKRATSRKCFRGRCLCFHKPHLAHCR